MFITFEGIEGSGKSTQARRLASALGGRAILTREPGATGLGRGIRTLLLESRETAISAMAETLLFLADRAQHVNEVIRPALKSKMIVICDRFTDSTIAYQCYGRGIPRRTVESLGEAATGGLRPDVSILLDLSVDAGFARIRGRGGADRMETEAREFHERVRTGYREMVAADPDRWSMIEAEKDVEALAERVRWILEKKGVRFGSGL
ncbi:MAG: dTMP kinase [Vicinamibacteria bacterium]|nr:dTMP kinase [Vicinamibacteria bacterium]